MTPKYVLFKSGDTSVEEGLGASLRSDKFTITGLTVGTEFTLSIYVNNFSGATPQLYSKTGFTYVDYKITTSTEVVFSGLFVGIATDSTITIRLTEEPEVYNVMAYQAC